MMGSHRTKLSSKRAAPVIEEGAPNYLTPSRGGSLARCGWRIARALLHGGFPLAAGLIYPLPSPRALKGGDRVA